MTTLDDLLMHCNPDTLATIIADLETQDDGSGVTVRELIIECNDALAALVGDQQPC